MGEGMRAEKIPMHVTRKRKEALKLKKMTRKDNANPPTPMKHIWRLNLSTRYPVRGLRKRDPNSGIPMRKPLCSIV